MPHVSVRQATAADLPLLVPLFDAYRQFYGFPRDLEGARRFLRQRFEHDESVIFLAFDGAVPRSDSPSYTRASPRLRWRGSSS